MGYSCTKAANDTLDAIGQMFATNGNPNYLTIRGAVYFFERGREKEDGAIVGKLFILLNENQCQEVGSVRINPNGTVARFPKITLKEKEKAQIFKGRIILPGVML